MKSISTFNPAITKNTECLIVKECASLNFIDLKVGMSLNHGVSLRFISLLTLQTCWQAKNNVRSAPASSALTLVSHQSHNTHTTNCHQHGSIEKAKENKGKLQ